MTNNESGRIDAWHEPVMLTEVLELLQCKPGDVVVDATIGTGGHARAILERICPGGLLIGVDRDKESLDVARQRLEPYADNLRLLHENFKNLPLALNNMGITPVHAILADLGISSYQLQAPGRGFSLQSGDLLDMRMDRMQRLTAADLIKDLPKEELAGLLRRYGDERFARRIASAVVRMRGVRAIARCDELAALVKRTVPLRGRLSIHPATRTFQALRIAVNQELERLEPFLIEAVSFLRQGGKLAVVAFHSGEDKIVKRAFRQLAGDCICERPPDLCLCPRKAQVRRLTPRALKPGAAEVEANPRCRSARLRAVERI